MMAIKAAFAGFPDSMRCAYLAFSSGLKRAATRAGTVERLADLGASAANDERPIQRPDCQSIGARPARLAVRPASWAPSLGVAIRLRP
jgi:hypothetical protein